MDLFKELIELNNKIELQKLAKEIYESASDDDDDEIIHKKQTIGMNKEFIWDE